MNRARVAWLNCIARDCGSVSTKVQLYLTNDRVIEWCSAKNVHFKSLKLKFTKLQPCSITSSGALQLSTHCIRLEDFELNVYDDSNHAIILTELGQRCSKLKMFRVSSSSITNADITPLMSRNPDLEDIEFSWCVNLSDDCLKAIAANCFKLRRISFIGMMECFTDQGVTVLVSANHDLKELQFDQCSFYSDCRKLPQTEQSRY